jgi:hypothetical protein
MQMMMRLMRQLVLVAVLVFTARNINNVVCGCEVSQYALLPQGRIEQLIVY